MTKHQGSQVNIVVRTKNRLLFLERALSNIEEQTFHDWSVVVVNDGGDQNELLRFMQEHPKFSWQKISVLHNESSLGRAAAANTGIRANPQSEFIAIHDDDDTWAPSFLEKTVRKLVSSPELAAVVVPTEIIYEQMFQKGIKVLGRQPFFAHMQDSSLIDFLSINRAVPIGVLYRHKFISEAGFVNEDLPVVEDWDLNLRLLQLAPFGFLPGPPLAFWHQRPGVTGDSANSMTELALLHVQLDKQLRDSALREFIEREGLGLPLLLGYQQRHLEDRLERIEQLLQSKLSQVLLRRTRKFFRRNRLK